MPLMGKRLKAKNLSTVTLTGKRAVAKPVRRDKANKRRIILGSLREAGPNTAHGAAKSATNHGWRCPSLPVAPVLAARRRPYSSCLGGDTRPTLWPDWAADALT